jgi:hypothetical protein
MPYRKRGYSSPILYSYDDLDYQEQCKAWFEHSAHEVDWGWWEFVYDMIEEVFEIIGMDADQSSFSFDLDRNLEFRWRGSYGYAKQAAKKLAEKYKGWNEIEDVVSIAKRLQLLQKKTGYLFTASGRFPFFSGWEPEVYRDGYGEINYNYDLNYEFESLFCELEHWAKWQLQSACEDLQSEENAISYFKVYGVYFDKDGEEQETDLYEKDLVEVEVDTWQKSSRKPANGRKGRKFIYRFGVNPLSLR